MRTRLHQLAHQRLRDGLHHDGDLVAAGLLFAASVLDQLRGASWRSSDDDGPGGGRWWWERTLFSLARAKADRRNFS